MQIYFTRINDCKRRVVFSRVCIELHLPVFKQMMMCRENCTQDAILSVVLLLLRVVSASILIDCIFRTIECSFKHSSKHCPTIEIMNVM